MTFSPKASARAAGIGVDRRIGVVIARCHRQRQRARSHEARQIIDMAVGMIVDQPVAQPQQPFDPQVAVEPCLDLLPRQMRVAVGVEQALFGGDAKTGAVDIDRAAFEHPVRLG